MSSLPLAVGQRDIAIFGLSGNPPTGDRGHTGIVKYLAKSNLFQETRVDMCQLAFESYSSKSCRVRVLKVEQEVEAMVPKHGTIDTLNFIKSHFSQAHLHLILGSDTYHDIAVGKWKQGDKLFQFATLHIIERLDAHPPTPLHLLSEDSSQAQGGETQTKTKTETEVLLVTNTQSATESQTDALTGIHSQTQTRTQTKTQTQTQTQSQSIQAPVQEHRVSWLDDTMSSTVLREVNPYPLWPFSLLLFGSSRGTGGGAVSSSSYLADPSNISPQVFEYIQQQHIFFFSKSYLNAMKRSRIACLSLMCWGLCNYFMKVKSISR